MSVELQHYDRVIDSPGYQLVMEGWNYCVQNEYAPVPGWFMIDPASDCLIAFDNGEPVGVMVWTKKPTRQAWTITLSYVEPASEGNGVYSMLYEEVRKLAVANGIRTILSMVAHKNERMHKIKEKLGLKVDALVYRDDL